MKDLTNVIEKVDLSEAMKMHHMRDSFKSAT